MPTRTTPPTRSAFMPTHAQLVATATDPTAHPSTRQLARDALTVAAATVSTDGLTRGTTYRYRAGKRVVRVVVVGFTVLPSGDLQAIGRHCGKVGYMRFLWAAQVVA